MHDLDAVLLRRTGTVHLDGARPAPADSDAAAATDATATTADAGLTALEADLADRGRLLTAPLRAALAALDPAGLVEHGTALLARLDALLGADRTHRPLFSGFPNSVPTDVDQLYGRRILALLRQRPDQPCVLCTRTGTVRAVSPCFHLVCAACWDGAGYTACPVCGRRLTPGDPFTHRVSDGHDDDRPAHGGRRPRDRPAPHPLRPLLLAADRDATAAAELRRLLARATPPTPQDRDDTLLLLTHLAGTAPDEIGRRLPTRIPVRETKALVLAALLRDPRTRAAALAELAARLDTATDVLRLLSAWSDGTAGLDGRPGRMRGVPRWLRRELLAVLDRLDLATAAEEMLRREAWWKRAGEVLHPYEAHARHPRAALAFALLRRTDPFAHQGLYDTMLPTVARHESVVELRYQDTGPRLRLVTWGRLVERALAAADLSTAVTLLRRRPGELLRRLDQLLTLHHRGLGAAVATTPLPEGLADALREALPRVAPGVLLGALGSLRTRTVAGGHRWVDPAKGGLGPAPAAPSPFGQNPFRQNPFGPEALAAGAFADVPRRVFFPRGSVARARSVPELRPPLTERSVGAVLALMEAEVLRRFEHAAARHDGAEGPAGAVAEVAVIDTGLAAVPVPATERTTAKALVPLPRGSAVPLPAGDVVRLFLHWKEPPGVTVDLDLSVAFYGADWRLLGMCDYTRLVWGQRHAVHSGDLTSAPAPDGATEYVDLDLPALAADGVRYAVPVVFGYNDVPFERLPDAFAGLLACDPAAGDLAGGAPAAGSRRQRRPRRSRRGRPGGAHYNPGAVRQRFDLTGDSRVCVPLVVDLAGRTALWVDTHLGAVGGTHGVARHGRAIGLLARDLTRCFEPGRRVSMRELAVWRAAAGGAAEIVERDADGALWSWRRGTAEAAAAFATRVLAGAAPDGVPAVAVDRRVGTGTAGEPRRPEEAAGAAGAPDPVAALIGRRRAFLALRDGTARPVEARGTVYRVFPGEVDGCPNLERLTAGDLLAELAPPGSSDVPTGETVAGPAARPAGRDGR
ncbi:MXAN_6230/SCO0854 family RING domain-containing protein [Allostreptomyces psammosilenae]|uniref:RING-type domain-containing protein n=1 Tax=Allostreptomyces psammosilenae TaxID=1892865 RepID=A0A852ZRH0_9ACTN|nr:MXAN_6230/SCO0854 family RING domain-containing protein [Allostreptomyces psammosilenae]NYI05046.1 hypothetical protein [Allostreptomyces psammosilenae]